MSNLTGRAPTPWGAKPKRAKSIKGGRETEATKKARALWANGFILCGMCEVDRAVHTHHMRMGCERYDQAWNWFPSCRDCHELIHNPTKRLWLIFLAKRKRKCDPFNYDRGLLLGG